MKILVLTDHLSHTEHDSIFSLFKEISLNDSCESLYIGSRGTSDNQHFFEGKTSNEIYCKKYDEKFTYCNKSWWELSSLSRKNTSEFNVIFLRIDYPINKKFLINLDQTFKGLIINNPNGTLKTGTKEYLLNFASLTPKIWILSDINRIKDISISMDIVIKPLRNYGGKGLIRLGKENYIGNEISTFSQTIEEIKKLLEKEKKVIVNEYLHGVTKGDKRIIVVNGKILGAILRLPSKGKWLCNLKEGARYIQTDITQNEEIIAKETSQVLKKEGVVLYGFDTLLNKDGKRVLTEINTSNVGGFVQIEKLGGKNIVKDASDLLVDYINEHLTSRAN